MLVALAACTTPEPRIGPGAPAARVETAVTDSAPDERPDSVRSTPADNVTMILALLPAPRGSALDGVAAALAERAVFAPRTQRWFIARAADDGTLALDVGRIDGGVGSGDVERMEFHRMLAARSPVQQGMTFTVHTPQTALVATVTGLMLNGRRIVARLDTPPNLGVAVAPVEWRGQPGAPLRESARTPCLPGDSAAIEAAIARFTSSRTDSVSSLRGCFGAFRAIITVRPRDITPESVERVIMVRTTGAIRSGKLRDLSYPLHELLAVTDIDGNGTQEILVHSFRPAMETWAALRMTDSVAFTRFASGFTIEKR